LLDSAWENTATVVIQWDAFWNKDLTPYPGDTCSSWPILLIQILDVLRVEYDNYDDIGGVQRTISDLETQTKNGQYVSEIMDVYGGKVLITHMGIFRILCYDVNGTHLNVQMPQEPEHGKSP
jgi:hypothetical protein